ncbi:MAG TPA: DUF5996 family protein [Bryobacteraceae bacterium]|nr:DUF5996 family protein [Bryobacteraceae bacterium]
MGTLCLITIHFIVEAVGVLATWENGGEKEGILDKRNLQSVPAPRWPELPLASWAETAATLHMWTQIVGKIRMALSPHVNHWWEVPLYVSARGLSTSVIPYSDRLFEMEFDFLDNNLAIRDSAGATRYVPLYARSVADFYREVMAVLYSVSIDVKIWPHPIEIPDAIPFQDDTVHASYDAGAVATFHRILMSVHSVLSEFRSGFVGKSPVHFFWGSFDLAVTRFSGRRAPERPGADAITREAYSHECSSAGFWPGSGPVTDAAFYSYMSPEPPGYSQNSVRPEGAFYHPELKEYFLMYEDARKAPSPKEAVMEFLQSTYDAGATLGGWDRAALERPSSACDDESHSET